MSKISQYLNEHLLGEVTTNTSIRRKLSTDNSILSIAPDIAVYPRVTNDIRKVLKFTHQLAQKGHTISTTVRGAGTDQTGAAIGPGIAVITTAHMNNVYEFDSKQRLVRVQPGASFATLQTSLKIQGCYIPAFPDSIAYSTIGGAIANNASGRLSGQHGAIDESVQELEVVLSNGDVIQTSRLTKKQLNRKKGLQTFEGDIYRAVDNLIEDNRTLLDEIASRGIIDNSGYANLSKVKQKNGSFDLTPLFVGSQGTLGVISEMILKASFANNDESLVAIALPDTNSFIDLVDELRKLSPDSIEVFDRYLIARARLGGKKHTIFTLAEGEGATKNPIAGIVLCAFQSFNERTRKRNIKKVRKLAEKFGGTVEEATTHELVRETASLRGIPYSGMYADEKAGVVPSIFRGVYIPHTRFEEFREATAKLEKATGIRLPYSGFATDGVYNFWPQVQLRTATDKQKLLKLYDAFAQVVYAHDGSVVGEAGEGRFKTPFIGKQTDADTAKMYADLRAIFDPYTTLNAGVKQPTELRSIVAHLRTGYDGIDEAGFTSPN